MNVIKKIIIIPYFISFQVDGKIQFLRVTLNKGIENTALEIVVYISKSGPNRTGRNPE